MKNVKLIEGHSKDDPYVQKLDLDRIEKLSFLNEYLVRSDSRRKTEPLSLSIENETTRYSE